MRDLRYLYFCVCACGISCSGKHAQHALYPASGKVLINGQPAKGVEVVLHPPAEWGNVIGVCQGITDEQGLFKLSTDKTDDGAPAGHFAVTVTWPSFIL